MQRFVRDAAGIACIDKPGAGGMGIHYVGPGVGDIDLDPGSPGALVYEPDPHGALRLVAAEYIVFQLFDDWNPRVSCRYAT